MLKADVVPGGDSTLNLSMADGHVDQLIMSVCSRVLAMFKLSHSFFPRLMNPLSSAAASKNTAGTSAAMGGAVIKQLRFAADAPVKARAPAPKPLVAERLASALKKAPEQPLAQKWGAQQTSVLRQETVGGIPLSSFRKTQMQQARAADLSKFSSEAKSPASTLATGPQRIPAGRARISRIDSRKEHGRQQRLTPYINALKANLLKQSKGALGDSLFAHAVWKVSQVQDELSQGMRIAKDTVAAIRNQALERCGFPAMPPIASFLANLASTTRLPSGEYIPRELKDQVADAVYDDLRRQQPVQLAQIHTGKAPEAILLPSLSGVQDHVCKAFAALVARD